ncbi:hypothetical protein AVEN_209010-1 [Araneus ventricosus]|uniref:Uncharacterized protein n=1 Tax=Araneus ventricosus TaxID=182803 RepID=A0A4Y2X8X7_ARAVE|nr:hypothetical protein AVEN_209010-1 [Araneus ventricosus]
MNSRRFPSPRKPLWELRFTTQTHSLTLARPKIRLARIEPTKPAGAGVVVRVLTKVSFPRTLTWIKITNFLYAQNATNFLQPAPKLKGRG